MSTGMSIIRQWDWVMKKYRARSPREYMQKGKECRMAGERGVGE